MLPIASALLTMLAQNGLNTLAGAIQAKGKEAIEEKLGVKIPDAPTNDDMIKLKQLEIDHEEFLVSASIKREELALKEIELSQKDTASARDMNTRVNESANATILSKNVPAYLAIIVIVCGFFMLATKTDPNIITAVVGLMTLVLGFYFGSSKSSRDKDEAIKALTEAQK